MRVRKLDANGDKMFGHSSADFWINVPEGVAQAVGTRLALWQGDWWLDLSQGMTWKTQVLGKYTGDVRDVAIQNQILNTPGMQSLGSYASQLTRGIRQFAVQTVLVTQYGVIPFLGPI